MSEPLSRTSLTPFAKAMSDPDPAAARRIAQRAFEEHGVVIILPSDVKRGIISSVIVDAIVRLLYPSSKRR